MHTRISDPSDFSGFSGRCHKAGNEWSIPALSGDFSSSPLDASRMLISRSNPQLTIPERAADFRAETDWRLNLRPATREATLRKRIAEKRVSLKLTHEASIHPASLSQLHQTLRRF